MSRVPVRKRPTAPSSVAVVRKTLVAQLVDLQADLPTTRPLAPEEVHDCRKRLKRLRASLALLRTALDERTFLRCDDALRAAGKVLSRARNAAALAQTEDELLAAPRKRGRGAQSDQRRRTGGTLASPSRVNQTRTSLASAARSLRAADLQARGWAPLGAGLRRVYRRGRRVMPAKATSSGHRLHAWRRHVKRYGYLLETFEPMNAKRIGPQIRQARRLADLLGREHDLALLEARLKRRDRKPGPTDARALQKIGPRRARLAAQAVRVGRSLYAAKPRHVEAELLRDWERIRARRRA